jgi:hypothetical protein
MGFSLYNLLLLFLVGVWLAAMMGGWTARGDLLALRQLHLGLGLFGWIALLIVSGSFQVIEMFYVTPAYPTAYARHMPFALTGLLTLELIAALHLPAAIPSLESLVALLLLAHALLTLRRLSQRQRPLADATVWFWRTGMASLALAAPLIVVRNLVGLPAALEESLYALFASFALSVVFAMSYKIVPFLVWFHLNAKGVLECPMMGDVIPASRMRPHLWLHWALGAAAPIALFAPLLWKVAALIFLAESILFGLNLVGAARIYHQLKDKGILS